MERSVAGTRPTRVRAAWPLFAVLMALLALLAGLISTGAARPGMMVDPGAAVRWGLPIVGVVVRSAAGITIGAFGVAALVLAGPRGGGETGAQGSGAWLAAVRIGMAGALVWVIMQVAYVVLSYAAVWGRSPGEATFGDELWFFLTRTELGVTLVWETILAVVVSVLAVSTATATMALWTGVMGAIALVPVALTGHAAGSVAHNLAVSSQWLHLSALSLWLGGLAVLVAIFRVLGPELEAAAARYSMLALWAFVFVGGSGVFASLIRLNSPLDLVTHPWGRLLAVKVVAFALLGAAGWWHRSRTIPRLGSDPRQFWRLALGEVLVMAGVMGVAIAMSSSAPPVPQDPVVDASPVFALTSYPEPPPPTVTTWLTQWHPDPLYLAAALAAVIVYLRWVRRLAQRGDRWPLSRTVTWVIAWVLFTWVVNGGPYVYGVVLFSAHMVMHMLLVMLIPIFFALAAPITLLLRAVPPRRDGSRGPREWILALIHSPWAQAWANPWVAGVNFVGSLFLFYYTDLLSLALRHHVGHVLMVLHFSLAGYLFMNAVIGTDPGTKRPTHAVRLIMLFAAMIFHGFFGLSLASMTSLLAADFYGRLGLSWWVDALADQQVGGFATWGIGELPTLVIAILLAVEWSQADARDARRIDRAADRDHDAELAAYNEMLARRAAAHQAARGAAGGGGRGEPAAGETARQTESLQEANPGPGGGARGV